jgi:hypothetical protein
VTNRAFVPAVLVAAICSAAPFADSADPSTRSGSSRAQSRDDKSMTVFLTAAQVTDIAKVDKETEKRLQQAIRDASKKRKDLEKALKAQHGNKRENWPETAQDQYLDAQEAEVLASADWAYRKVKQEGLVDSVEDIRQALTGHGLAGKKENVKLVDTAADAEFVVEVVGRRSGHGGQAGGLLAIRADQYWILFAIKAGPKLSAQRFAAVPLTYRFKRFGQQGWRLARPAPDTPEWRFEAYGDMRWANAAHVVSLVIEDFIAKNDDAMMKASGTN